MTNYYCETNQNIIHYNSQLIIKLRSE